MSQEQPIDELPSPLAGAVEGEGEGAAALDPSASSGQALQAQFDALHQEMEQRATEAEQRRIDLEAQLEQTQATIEALSQQLTDAANHQVEALKRAVIAENADQVIPELVRGA